MPAVGGHGSLSGCRHRGWLPGEGAAAQCLQCPCTCRCQWRGRGGRWSHTGPPAPPDSPLGERTGLQVPVDIAHASVYSSAQVVTIRGMFVT